MARSKVDYERVEQACETLVEAGENVTVAAVRGQLGEGSNTTILPFLRQWHRVQNELRAAKETVDDDFTQAVVAAASALVSRQQREAQAEATLRIAELEDLCDTLQGELAAALSRAGEFEADAASCRLEHADLETAFERHRQTSQTRLDALEARDAERSTELRSLRESFVSAKEAAAGALARVEAAVARADSSESQLSALREESSVLRTQLGTRQSTLDTLDREVAALRENARGKEQQMDDLRSQLRIAQDEAKSTRVDCKEQIQSYRDDLERERDRTERLRESFDNVLNAGFRAAEAAQQPVATDGDNNEGAPGRQKAAPSKLAHEFE